MLILGVVTVCSPAAAHPPYGLVVDRANNVYFSDLETVWRLSPDGRLSVFRPPVPETHVHELALAPDGAIEGVQNRYDPASQRFSGGLWSRTEGGNERAIVPMTERPPLGVGIWQDGSGNRYTAQWLSNTDQRTVLLRRRRDGQVDVLFDEAPGAKRPPQPSVASVGGMAFGADGALYFADRGKLRRLALGGTVTKLYDGGTRSSLRGIAAAPDGGVLAADMAVKVVLSFAADGNVSTLYTEKGKWRPTAVALARGRLLVLEANADPYDYVDRVRLIEVNDGQPRVVAQPAKQQAVPASTSLGNSKGTRSSSTVLLASIAGVLILAAVTWWSSKGQMG